MGQVGTERCNRPRKHAGTNPAGHAAVMQSAWARLRHATNSSVIAVPTKQAACCGRLLRAALRWRPRHQAFGALALSQVSDVLHERRIAG